MTEKLSCIVNRGSTVSINIVHVIKLPRKSYMTYCANKRYRLENITRKVDVRGVYAF